MKPIDPQEDSSDSGFVPPKSPYIIELIGDDEKAGNPLPPLAEAVPGRPLTKDEIDEMYRKWE